MFQQIYNILVSFLGESKQGGYDKNISQYQFNCPKCTEDNYNIPDYKYNLEICLSITKLAYKCWKCCDTDGTKGNLSKLVKKYGGTKLYKTYKETLKSIISYELYNIDTTYLASTLNDETHVHLPSSFKLINDINKCDNKYVVNYLKKRKITQQIISKFKIGYTDNTDKDYYCRNRIVVPSYDEYGCLNYWSARDFLGNAKIKYKNCKAKKTDLIFCESLINYDADIILCEGTFDALYIPNSISLLGKTLKKDSKLYRDLLIKSNGKIIICLDSDTQIEETFKIYNLLNHGRLKNNIYYLRLKKYKDFGELFEFGNKKNVIAEISDIKQFDSIEKTMYE